jgi:hypothetical protein
MGSPVENSPKSTKGDAKPSDNSPMGGFAAALKVGADTEPLSTKLEVEGGRLIIRAADQKIGDWALSDLEFERVSGGYRLDVEGEELILDVEDLLGFQEAISVQPAKRRRSKHISSPNNNSSRSHIARERQVRASLEATSPADPEDSKSEETTVVARSLGVVDSALEKAKASAGSDWPGWIFTRWTVFSAVALVLLVIVLPGVFSTMFLIGGLGAVVLGAVLYTDDAMARRWLPGRITALHVLIGGTGLAVLGVLIAVLRGS